jgi:hypothetical protein
LTGNIDYITVIQSVGQYEFLLFFQCKSMAEKAAKRGGAREGAGRPVSADGPSVTLTVTVPETLVAELGDVAAKEGWSRSKAATEAIRAFVKRKKRA